MDEIKINHLSFLKPRLNGDEKLWRYMRLSQFIHILRRRELFFSPANKFSDPYEGEYPEMENLYQRLWVDGKISKEHCLKKQEEHRIIRNKKSNFFISCWHKNEVESAAMWDLYSSNEDGVAIVIKSQNLVDLMHRESNSGFVGYVQYVDLNEYQEQSNHDVAPYFFKRKSFSHENEVRAVTTKGSTWSISPGNFINQILVHPKVQDWLFELVRDISRDYGLTGIQVEKSNLYTLN